MKRKKVVGGALVITAFTWLMLTMVSHRIT